LRLSNPRFLRLVLATLAVLSFLNLTTHSQALGASESILWNFNDLDGLQPLGLIMDTGGNLYGTTIEGGPNGNRGTVFELTPPSTVGGEWTQSVLWNFGNGTDGIQPEGAPIMDTSGNLYGTTYQGGAYVPGGSSIDPSGTAFELSPPATIGGNWTESVLWNFGTGTDGSNPSAGLVADDSGNLYGTTSYGGTFHNSNCPFIENASCGGTAFELTPPSTIGGSWTESVLWNFGNGTDGQSPDAPLIIDKKGNLYGTTICGGKNGKSCSDFENSSESGFADGGTVFELTPPATIGGAWTESILWNFGNGADGIEPQAGLIMDSSGNLYGTTSYGGAHGSNPKPSGTVFKLSPPSTIGGTWTESILWSFGKSKDGNLPVAGLILDLNGNLYGTTAKGGTNFNPKLCKGSGPVCGGTVFELTPSGSESILWSFGKGEDGNTPSAGLILDGGGNLFGTAANGGAFAGKFFGEGGTVFEIPTRTVLTASMAQLNFGNLVAPGTSKPKKVTLTNQGTLPAQISRVTATAPFKIAAGANTCSGKAPAPKRTCSFEVEFAPTTVSNDDAGSVDVTYNGASPLVTLVGNGIAK